MLLLRKISYMLLKKYKIKSLYAFEGLHLDVYTEDCNIYFVAMTVQRILGGLIRKRCKVELVEEHPIAVKECSPEKKKNKLYKYNNGKHNIQLKL